MDFVYHSVDGGFYYFFLLGALNIHTQVFFVCTYVFTSLGPILRNVQPAGHVLVSEECQIALHCNYFFL